MIPEGQQAPQASNFKDWSELIANSIAHGPRNERIRGYLKALAKETWELAGWLTASGFAEVAFEKVDGDEGQESVYIFSSH